MDLQIIGAGLGRTGTLSMKTALEQLGLGPCHHMIEAFGRPEDFGMWAAAIRGEDVDLDRLLDDFRSTLDFPACTIWRELAEQCPDAKVLLTTRSSESWWRSFDATIGPSLRSGGTDDSEAEAIDDLGALEMLKAINESTFPRGSVDRDEAIAAFEAHNAAVVAEVSSDRLLVYEVGSGWEPLCDFLGVDVPEEPFPSSNSTAEFTERKAAQARGETTESAAGRPTAPRSSG